jgi:uncharacterized repeat protein (TIGR02543 family)
VSMTQDKNVTASFSVKTQRYTLSVTNGGHGRITSDKGGIDCGGNCSASFDSGASVQLTATADTGYQFDQWSGDACNGSTDPTCAVSMTQNKSVTASFKIKTQQYTLKVTNGGNGRVASDKGGIDCGSQCTASFDSGASVQLIASADSGYTFDKWSGDVCNGSANSICAFTITKNTNVTASFTAIKPKLTVTKSGNGTGTVTSDPAGIDCGAACAADFTYNQLVTLTAQATNDSEFSGWSGCDQIPPTALNTCIVTMSQTRTVGATFDPPGKRTLAISKEGLGTVTSDPAGIDCGVTCVFDFDYNQVVTLSAQPDEGYSFAGWSGADCSGTGTCTVTMVRAWSITAVFSSGKPILTIFKPGTGSGTVTSEPAGINCGAVCSHEFSRDQQVTLTAQALSGSLFTGWTGCSSQSGSKCWVTMSRDQNITALFNRGEAPRKTVLIYPSGSIAVKKATYKWTAVAEASWYRVWVNDSYAAPKITDWLTAAQAGCAAGTGTCSTTPEVGLDPGSYRWWVQCWNDFGSVWSDPMSFTVISTPPAAVLVSPSGTVSTNKPTFKWNAVATASWYQLWVNDSYATAKIKDLWLTAAQAGCAAGSGTCLVTPDIALGAGSYRWWIQTWNESGYGPWSMGLSFTVPNMVGPPGKATLVSPSGVASSNMPTYTWNAVANASWYQLWVNDAATASGSWKIKKWYTSAESQCASGSGKCSVAPTAALAPGTATWWIQTWNSSGEGPWSDAMSFAVSAGYPPEKAVLSSPSGAITTTSPAYTWKTILTATRYLLLVKDSSGTVKIRQWYSAQQAACFAGTNTCTISPAVTLTSGAYQWWIQTSNSYGDGPWSDPLIFTIMSLAPGSARQ